MVVNAVAPWEGQLVWVGTPNGGFSQQSGQEWKSVEFALKYTDMRLQEKNIVFSAFGLDITNRILSIPLGSTVRVTWSPSARQGQDGRWWGKFEAFGVTAVQPQAVPQQVAQPTAPAPQAYPPQGYPAYPQPGTSLPQQAPVYQQPAPPQYQPQGSPAFQALARPDADEDLPM